MKIPKVNSIQWEVAIAVNKLMQARAAASNAARAGRAGSMRSACLFARTGLPLAGLPQPVPHFLPCCPWVSWIAAGV